MKLSELEARSVVNGTKSTHHLRVERISPFLSSSLLLTDHSLGHGRVPFDSSPIQSRIPYSARIIFFIRTSSLKPSLSYPSTTLHFDSHLLPSTTSNRTCSFNFPTSTANSKTEEWTFINSKEGFTCTRSDPWSVGRGYRETLAVEVSFGRVVWH